MEESETRGGVSRGIGDEDLGKKAGRKDESRSSMKEGRTATRAKCNRHLFSCKRHLFHSFKEIRRVDNNPKYFGQKSLACETVRGGQACSATRPAPHERVSLTTAGELEADA